ncbi:CHASE2 domain-containing protein [Brunnivagina elsteri]|uniref:Sensor protein Chase2 n=1 Tax=Brunnivagina elsteri CCALA 953 TaxID=987040 RepID=A0A2A2TH22_9CYAN|nr:CHASE2 domain-containing protein [Calothrix elsteri]PAX52928.1 sensor protein Chase2 [Calothrix elsteri CCALA 953]
MGKLVVLKFGNGSFEQGFQVTLQIATEGELPSVEIVGRLPEAIKLPIYYQHWQCSYQRLGNAFRLSADKVQVTNVSITEDCQETARTLRSQFNSWLRSESFLPLREKWLERLALTDEVRVILQTEDNLLQRLPWHSWDLLERYKKAEIALTSPNYERSDKVRTTNYNVKILAIVGSSQGIDTQADRALLQNLPDADVTFLVEPQRQQLNDHLWEDNWDILFFAGHSLSHNDESGRIYLNQSDSLSMAELRYALGKAVDNGLYLAIFNSCDGLGLARELTDLQIPEIIFMREAVPDKVASEFLKYFLCEFANSDLLQKEIGNPKYESFFLAVRQARERLQGIEDKFPCATWLPMICHNNPAQIPLTWQQLHNNRHNNIVTENKNNTESLTQKEEREEEKEEEIYLTANETKSTSTGKAKQTKPLFAIVSSIAIALLICGIRLLGLLEGTELQSFDQMMRSRFVLVREPPDSRIIVVGIDDTDLGEQRRQGELLKGTSISDKSLNLLLEKLEQYQPRVIGLDIYRDFKAENPELIQRLQQTQNLVAVCKGSDISSNNNGIKPPPEIPQNSINERLGFSDFIQDKDGIIRRQLLYMRQNANSLCSSQFSLSLQLAFHYFQSENIKSPKFFGNNLKIAKTSFNSLRDRTGGYQKIDAEGGQILLNWRISDAMVQKVTLREVLTGQINPDAFKDKIVLIGVTAKADLQDYLPTPYGSEPDTQLPGVLIHAHMLSQILSAVLSDRPLLQTWTQGIEIIWIVFWSLTGGILAWQFHRQPMSLLILIITSTGMLYIISIGMLISGYWIPFVPSAISLTSAAVVVIVGNTKKIHYPKL